MRFTLSLMITALVALSACNRDIPIRAETIYTGGTIYTGRTATETVEAVAVGENYIVYAGDMKTAIKASKDGAKIVSLGNAVMFPGFVDSHAHLLGIGQRELTLNLDQAETLEDFKAAILDWRETYPESTSIQGRGWIETHWPEGRFPNAADIDAVVSDIPVILRRADGHALVANTKAIELAGITSETPDPVGGEILKTETGKPDGMFIDLAMALLRPVFSAPDEDQVRLALSTGYDVYASRGWTGLHNMSVGVQELDQLGDMSARSEIKLRTYNAVQPDLMDRAVNRSPTGPLLSTRAVKLYVDGALGSRGALLFAPYTDKPDTTGLILTPKEQALGVFNEALAGRVQIAMHAIGDRGNRLVLDWMAEAFKGFTPPAEEASILDDPADVAGKSDISPRWRIEHAQLVRPEDQTLFADLGVIASMQPSHAIGDLYFAPARLGPDRLDGAYAWKSFLGKGVMVAGGSDAPVEVGDPVIEFYAATVRKGLRDGYSDAGWHREQAISRYEALKLFTQNAAFASFQEDQLGTIETGKLADFTVFDQDLLTIPDEAILTTHPLMTIVGGEVVWKAENRIVPAATEAAQKE